MIIRRTPPSARRSRRRFLAGATVLIGSVSGAELLAGCGPLRRQAQRPRKVPLVGYLSVDPLPNTIAMHPFSQGLHDLGYVDGTNIRLDFRFLNGELDRLSEAAAELVRLKVDVLVVQSDRVALAARAQTSTIPIIVVGTGDPVRAGLVASLARPGGNVTGVRRETGGLASKRLELFKEAIPGLSRIGALWNPDGTSGPQQLSDTKAAASALGIEVHSFEIRGVNGLESALEGAKSAGDQGLLLGSGTVGYSPQVLSKLVDSVADSRLPAMYDAPEAVRAGGLICYGVPVEAMQRGAASYVDRILRGAKPAELPIEGPTVFDLVVNLKAAKAIGLTLPAALLSQATEVIQ